jgi:hypothetical protein
MKKARYVVQVFERPEKLLKAWKPTRFREAVMIERKVRADLDHAKFFTRIVEFQAAATPTLC